MSVPNLTVDVAIPVDEARGVVSLPREAVERNGGREFVWVADDEETVRRVPVEVGARSGERVEIRVGIDVGDQVLIPGTETLQEGLAVKIAEP